MNNIEKSSVVSPPAAAMEPAFPSLALPSLHCGSQVLISKPVYGGRPRDTTMINSRLPVSENAVVDLVTVPLDSETGKQRYSPRYRVVRQLVSKTAKGTTDSNARISRNPYRISNRSMHSRLDHGLSCLKNCEGPAVVDEQKAYWVVKKSICRPSSTKTGRTGNIVCDLHELTGAESLATFLQEQHPQEYFPLLSSRQHNFGVIFHLEDSWIGLNIVAKSEAAYASFQRLLELQLIHSFVECFVVGPPLRSATELFGTTATGKAKLCIQVLQSTVCRTAGCDETRQCGVNSVPSAGGSSTVVSHAIFRISFPPILLPDVLWCNGIAVTSNPYFRTTADGAAECYGSLCCFALTFPQVKLHTPSDRLQQKFGGNFPSRVHYEYKEKIYFQAFSLAGRLPTLSTALQYSGRLWICAGLFTLSPIVFYELLPRILGWLQNNKDSYSNASVQPAAFLIRGLINGISEIRQMLGGGYFPVGFTHVVPWHHKSKYMDAEFLFGQAEGRPWIDMFH